MKGIMKHLTMGAVLGLAVMVGGVGQANALLLGKDIQTTGEYPTMGTVVAGPVTTTVVDPGVELPGFGPVAIDFSDSLIKMTSLVSGPVPPATFNGVHFFDVNGTIPNWTASINVGLSTADVLGTVVTFDNNNIYANFVGLTLTAEESMLVLNVSAVPTNQPVPEPSTMLLLGSGLAGIVGWRYRKHQG